MPRTEVLFYHDEDGRAPVIEWLRELRRREADYLLDGIYELRVGRGHVNYRLLYFFHGQQVAILAHGLTKEGEIPAGDIERAKRRKDAFERHPERHTYEEETHDG